jgi:hypothetical protein
VQIESFLHYMEDDVFQDLKERIDHRTWWSRSWKPGDGETPPAP